MAPALNRREALSMLAVTAAGGVLLPRAAFSAETSKSLIAGADVCVITPEVTEGPFYFDPALVRRDITEGRPGLPTTLRLQVVDAECRPIHDARVDVWHCDATGIYSGYANQPGGNATGETFMRGTQMTGPDGVVEFATVYPGWYRGRTTHIHFKVFLDKKNVLTGQLFFPEEVSNAVYANVAPYNQRGDKRDTTNASDGIARQAGQASVAKVEQLADSYGVALVIGVDPNAVSATGFGLSPGGTRPAIRFPPPPRA